MTDDMITNLVVIVAMKQECEPFIKEHNLKENIPSPFHPGSPMVSYSGLIKSNNNVDIKINLVWNGKCKIHNVNHVATTAAGVSTYAAIAHFEPDLVISSGTAGGFSELGASIGDVYISTKCVFHSRRIPVSTNYKPSNKSAALFEEYGFGHFRSPPLNRLVNKTLIKQGVISTSDSLDCNDIDLQLMRSEGAVVKEMEAAAVAWVCQQLSVPFFAIKSITDIVDGDKKSEDEFYSNLDIATESLKIKLTSVINHIGGTSLESWNSYQDNNNKDVPLTNDRNNEINKKHENFSIHKKKTLTFENTNSDYDGNKSMMIAGLKIGIMLSIVTTTWLLFINSHRRK